MKTGQKVKVKSTQQIGTIVTTSEDLIKIYIIKRGTFVYAKSNLELIDRIPVSDCIENSQ